MNTTSLQLTPYGCAIYALQRALPSSEVLNDETLEESKNGTSLHKMCSLIDQYNPHPFRIDLNTIWCDYMGENCRHLPPSLHLRRSDIPSPGIIDFIPVLVGVKRFPNSLDHMICVYLSHKGCIVYDSVMPNPLELPRFEQITDIYCRILSVSVLFAMDGLITISK